MYLPLREAVLVADPPPLTTIGLLSTACTAKPLPADVTGGSNAEFRMRIRVIRMRYVPA